MNVSEFIIKEIENTGVDFIPIYQSGNALKLIDEAGKSNKITTVVPYHEQAVSMAVEAYARFKGFGVGIVGAGPAASNLATGVMAAYCDSIPCLFITGQVGMYHSMRGKAVRQRGFQELDVEGLMKPITKYSKLVDKAEDIKYELRKAIYIAKSGRPGPVLLDIPFNVQQTDIDPDELRDFQEPAPEPLVSDQQLSKHCQLVYEELSHAKRPVIMLGGGIRISGQATNIQELVKNLQIPVVTTWAAADIFGHDNPLYLGNVGRGGNRSAIYAIQECDFLLGLGTRFTTKAIIDDRIFASKAKITAVDIDLGELSDGLVNIEHQINCDLAQFVPALLGFSEEVSYRGVTKEWREYHEHLRTTEYIIDESREVDGDQYTYLSPYVFMRSLFEELSDNAIVIPDAGMNLTWTYQGSRVRPGQRIVAALGASPMGYAVPAAVGAYYANKDSEIICIVGDGGFQMNIQELETVRFNDIPIKIFVMNNESLGNTRFPAISMFGRSTGNDAAGGYGCPDFVEVANAYGLEAHVLDRNSDLIPSLRSILDSTDPCLIDVKIDPEQFMLDTPLS